MIRRLLVANRGEIALRIIRACRELGIESVAVFSAADVGAPHTVAADRAIPIGPPPAGESYLRIDRLLDAARSADADAVHPGYGFLAENAAFALACEEAGLVFVGPPAGAVAAMGSKTEARRLMEAAGVPVVPGAAPADQTARRIAEAAARLGFPLLVKASAGGGGRGMRLVEHADRLDEAVESARREALAAFGDGTLYVERRLEAPRHVEVQILADTHGAIVHLFERDCSTQRRHQKIVEESPSPAVTPALRDRMGAAAVAAGRAVGYRGAGTVEFLVEGQGDEARFYFLEMNTRLQVEHPVTEEVTGLDLVRAQLLAAGGDPLPWNQGSLALRGHAIECRIYAEDPGSGFLPQAGRILLYREPSGPGVRIDSGVVEGSEVPLHYDPLLAKLVVRAETREAARRRAVAALRDFPILGIRTNIAFLIQVLEHEAFRRGGVDTGLVERVLPSLLPAAERPPAAALAAAAVALGTPAAPGERASAARDPWDALRGWRS